MHPDAGIFYDITTRLRGQLAHHHWKLGKPFTASQEDAWKLLNEVEQLVKLIERLERYLREDKNLDLAHEVRHTLLMHQPAWKSELETSRVPLSSDPNSQENVAGPT